MYFSTEPRLPNLSVFEPPADRSTEKQTILALLTDVHISPKVARQVCEKNPNIVAHSLVSWRAGSLLEEDDGVILQAAADDFLTFVTYEKSTIAPLLGNWAGGTMSNRSRNPIPNQYSHSHCTRGTRLTPSPPFRLVRTRYNPHIRGDRR